MRDELMAPPNRRLTPNGADDVQHWSELAADTVRSVVQCGAGAWPKGLASGDQRRLMENSSALEVCYTLMRYTNTWLLYVTVLQTSVTYIIAPQTSSGAKNTKDTKQNKITLTPTNWLQLRKRCKTKPKPTVSVSHIMLVCICTVHIQLCTIVVDRTVLRLILQTSITQVLFMRRKVGGGELSAILNNGQTDGSHGTVSSTSSYCFLLTQRMSLINDRMERTTWVTWQLAEAALLHRGCIKKCSSARSWLHHWKCRPVGHVVYGLTA